MSSLDNELFYLKYTTRTPKSFLASRTAKSQRTFKNREQSNCPKQLSSMQSMQTQESTTDKSIKLDSLTDWVSFSLENPIFMGTLRTEDQMEKLTLTSLTQATYTQGRSIRGLSSEVRSKPTNLPTQGNSRGVPHGQRVVGHGRQLLQRNILLRQNKIWKNDIQTASQHSRRIASAKYITGTARRSRALRRVNSLSKVVSVYITTEISTRATSGMDSGVETGNIFLRQRENFIKENSGIT